MPNITPFMQQSVAALHRSTFLRTLPTRVAIYFHELEAHQHAAFQDGIRALRQLGYRAVGPQEYLASWSKSDTERLMFISFDDNYRSWHAARGLLDEVGIRATFYVNTLPFRDTCSDADLASYFERIAFHGERVTLSRAELRELAADGHTIGCHSHSHYRLAHLTESTWDAEILQCKHRLEELIGAEVSDFAFPYGMRRWFSQPLHDYCSKIGFRTVAAAIPAMLHVGVEAGNYIHRSGWRLADAVEANIRDLAVDGRLFEKFTGRSAIG